MNDEIKQAINQMGGLGEFKHQRKEEWDKLDTSLQETLDKIYQGLDDPCLRMKMKQYFTQDLFQLNQIKRFIDLNLIEEVDNIDETYTDIIFKVFNKYIEIKKASK